MTRKALSKKMRFEIFKRDGFTCQYCGATPPEAVLHVDHIVAVAAGGGNDQDNLITACLDCNLGKGARDLKAAPQSFSDKAAEVAEREEQLRGYQEILRAKRERIEAEAWKVAEIVDGDVRFKGSTRRDWFQSIKRFIEQLGFESVLDAAEIARARYTFGGKTTFLYFCGICWKRIRGE